MKGGGHPSMDKVARRSHWPPPEYGRIPNVVQQPSKGRIIDRAGLHDQPSTGGRLRSPDLTVKPWTGHEPNSAMSAGGLGTQHVREGVQGARDQGEVRPHATFVAGQQPCVDQHFQVVGHGGLG